MLRATVRLVVLRLQDTVVIGLLLIIPIDMPGCVKRIAAKSGRCDQW
jgi:hypothetical protein